MYLNLAKRIANSSNGTTKKIIIHLHKNANTSFTMIKNHSLIKQLLGDAASKFEVGRTIISVKEFSILRINKILQLVGKLTKLDAMGDIEEWTWERQDYGPLSFNIKVPTTVSEFLMG